MRDEPQETVGNIQLMACECALGLKHCRGPIQAVAGQRLSWGSHVGSPICLLERSLWHEDELEGCEAR